jgi:hypothetical protein
LDEVMNTVLASMPADQREARIFFPGEVTHEIQTYKHVWKEPEWGMAMGALGTVSGCFALGAALSTGGIAAVLLGIAMVPVVAGVGITFHEEIKRKKPSVSRRKEGTLVRFIRKEDGSFDSEVWLGSYGHSTSVLPPDAPAHERAVGDSGGWKVMEFSKVYRVRHLEESAVLREITKLTDAWSARAEREWGLADKLLRTHAENIGLS